MQLKLILPAIAAFVFVSFVYAAEEVAPSPAKQLEALRKKKKVRILWLGTSSTSRGLIQCTGEMLEKAGYTVSKNSKGNGYVLIYKSNFDKAEVAAGGYDLMIHQISYWTLNEKKNPGGLKAAQEGLRAFCSAARKSGAIPVLFEHYHPKKRMANQPALRKLCMDEAQRYGAVVAFCGSSWAAVFKEKRKKANLFAPDQLHANARGNYLMACAVFSAISGTSPIGNPVRRVDPRKGYKEKEAKQFKTLSDEEAAYLQKSAWGVHQKFKKR